MIGRDTLLDLMPHQGTMALLDEVVGFDATTLHARTRAHARTDNPLRDAQGLRAVHLCEVGAQATAAHGGLLAREAGGRRRGCWCRCAGWCCTWTGSTASTVRWTCTPSS